ncbi:MAG: 4-(cytidine 5'-diphospho)-2-C-methyl-D-erythritol kinase [Bacteroidales bacterium]|nr:4-(cytidine 5'-diphospho)-2-C-methyl-D-erythritol kinase [Bacteroidales bacterium]
MISFPNAKINLGLHVSRKRDDGFHDIETVLYPVPLCDALEIHPSGESKSALYLYGTPIPGGGDNLCMKAFDLMQQEYDLPTVNMHLLKQIPTGAGLGGGSSDAAQTLVLLNRLFSLGMSDNSLEDVARQVGSDCAFFIRNRPVIAYGRGDRFNPIELRLGGKYLLIIKPDIHISTAEAYAMIRPVSGRPSPQEIVKRPIEEWKDLLVNDFEKPLFEKYPEIGSIRAKIYEMGAIYASMSGSGSAVYGIFNTPPSIEQKDFNGCFIWWKAF